MIGTLAWKEYREQRSIWVALAALAVLLLVSFLEFLEPAGRSEILGGLAVVLACSYGLVCGAMLLAGEREGGTLGFLQSLTGRRGPLWTTKVAAGVGLTASQVLLIAGLLMVLGVFQPMLHRHGIFWLSVLFVLPLATFSWGLLGSAVSRNVLAAAGIGLGLLLVAQLPIVLLWAMTQSDLAETVAQGVLGLVALDISRRAFSRDRADRGSSDRQPAFWRGVLWLAFRQGWIPAVVLGVVSILTGLVLPSVGLPIWIMGTLVIGIIAGTTLWAGEQRGDTYRFLGDQRLAPGRFWILKTAYWLALAVAGTGLSFATAVMVLEISGGAAGPSQDQDSLLLPRLLGIANPELTPTVLGLSLGLAYGFATGQLLTLVVRKSVVAVVLTVLVGTAVLGLWLPSMLSGGWPAWQALVAPALLLAAGRAIMWPWVSGRLRTPRPVFALAGWAMVAAAWMAGCLWYRVAEIPYPVEPFDVKAFVASLPTPEQNQAAYVLDRAAKELEDQYNRANQQIQPVPKPAEPPDRPATPATFGGQVFLVVHRGWMMRTPELERWLDLVFEGAWVRTLQASVALPPGMPVDPRALALGNQRTDLGWYVRASELLQVRAMQLQERRQDDKALDLLVTVLALSRHLRHRTPSSYYVSGWIMEQYTLRRLNQWQEHLGRGDAALLRRALEAVTRHEQRLPSPTDVIKADYFLYRNTIDDPSRWAAATFRPSVPLGSDLTPIAFQAPWEQARRTRLLNAIFTLWLRSPETDLEALGQQVPDLKHAWFFPILPKSWSYTWAFDPRDLRRLRQTRLKLALALFEAENGQPAQSMNELVPRYLPEPLIDPVTETVLALPPR